jgi:LemA protein
MKKNIKKLMLYGLLTGILLILLAGCNPISVYNTIIEKEEAVNAAWAQVENVYQRRMDLIPNLVNIVKGYAQHEKDTLSEVIDKRNQASQITVTKEVLEDPEAFKKFQAAQGEISGLLSRLMVLTENYPDLKANQSFLALQTQLEGTENRITVERRKYNQAVQEFNTYIRKFPNNLIAGNKFKSKQMFEADKGANKAPTINFD